MSTITAANATLMLSIAGLYPQPVQIQGFATDDAFIIEAAEMAQVEMGVDGKMSAGFVPFPSKMTIALQADSISVPLFMGWVGAQRQAQEIYIATGSILLKNVGTSYDLINGVLVMATQMPEVKKVLGPHKFNITWAAVNPAPV